jgi:hypothetical protein
MRGDSRPCGKRRSRIGILTRRDDVRFPACGRTSFAKARQDFASRNLDFNSRRQGLKVFGHRPGKDIFRPANHDQQTPQGHAKESAYSLKSDGMPGKRLSRLAQYFARVSGSSAREPPAIPSLGARSPTATSTPSTHFAH